MQTVNIAEKLSQFQDTWSPEILGEVNDSYVKALKLKGEFVWHHHEQQDELLLVISGLLRMKFRDRDELVRWGES
jgi:mannose-6-phosphate isomerase-like protein (cupin superfamily)